MQMPKGSASPYLLLGRKLSKSERINVAIFDPPDVSRIKGALPNTLQLLVEIVNPNVFSNKLNFAVIVVLADRDSTVASQTLNGTWGTPLGSTVLLAIGRNPCGV